MATELMPPNSNDTTTATATAADVDVRALMAGGRYVALVGRFASMPRPQVGDLVAAHGGHFATRVAAGTSLVVVGQKDWLLTRDGTLPPALRVLRIRAKREHATIPVVSEEQFLRALGLAEHAGHVHPHYTTATLTDLLGVSHESVRGWVKAGLLEPAHTAHGVWYFDFRQATAAKTLCDLVRSGISLKRLRKSLEQLRAWMPEADAPLQQLSVLEHDGRLLVRLAEGDLSAPDGQLHFDFKATPGEASHVDGEDDGAHEPVLRIGPGAAGSLQRPGTSTGTTIAPRTAHDWFDLAVEQQSAGFLAEAAESFREALLVGGPDAQTNFDLAGVLHALGRRPEAVERYRQAVEIDPRFADAWNNLGTLLAETGHADEACAAFRRSLSIDPADARAHYNLADTLDDMGHAREAAPHWRAFLKQDQASAWAAHARKRLAAVI